MINQKLANVEIVTKPSLRSLYFIHHLPKRDRFDDFKHKIIHSFTNFYQPYYIFSRTKQWFLDNITEIKENDWELHKQYIKEGHNPNEITKIIRNDEIEKLQEISSQNDFNFNQYIIPSHYERCSFINKKNVTLIDYAAFFGSVKCFKYLLMNGAKVENTGKYAVAGGNEEIIHLCEQNHSSFYGSYETAIEFHRNDIFKYLYENKIIKTLDIKDLRVKCILYDSYKLLLYIMKKEDFKFNEFAIYESSHIGNIFLVKYFIGGHLIPKNILFPCAFSGNIELFRYVLENNEIDIDAKNIYLC